MKKVIHVVPTFELGGVQTGILYSLLELRKEYDFKILVVGVVDHGWIKNLSLEVQQNIVWSGSKNIIIGWVKSFFLLRKIKPDIVISSLWKSVPLTIAYKLVRPSVKLLGFFHSAHKAHAVDSFFLKLLSRVQDKAIADSTVTRSFIQQSFGITNVSIIFYHFVFKNKNSIPKSFDPEKIKLVYFGRISSAKGLTRAILFCKYCHEKEIRFQFDIYGDGDKHYYKKLIKALHLENNISIKTLLPLDAVISTMQAYDFLLQLSDYEGMALSVVEAMNCGLVPIVTPVGEIQNYSKDGINAIWLDTPFDENLEQLIEKLQSSIEHPETYQKLSAAASTTFINNKKYSEAMIEVLSHCLMEK